MHGKTMLAFRTTLVICALCRFVICSNDGLLAAFMLIIMHHHYPV